MVRAVPGPRRRLRVRHRGNGIVAASGGAGGLVSCRLAAGRAEFGRLIIAGEDARGLGLARLATARLVAEGHGALGLTDVYLTVLENNHAAIRVYDACGFHVTGRSEGAVFMSAAPGPA